jgi:hypothetical protein
MESVYINSLEELKEWNRVPTGDRPFAWDWYLDWIFIEVLEKVDYDLFLDAFDTMVEFTTIWEKISEKEAIERTIKNLQYVDDRNSYFSDTLKLFLKDIIENLN